MDQPTVRGDGEQAQPVIGAPHHHEGAAVDRHRLHHRGGLEAGRAFVDDVIDRHQAAAGQDAHRRQRGTVGRADDQEMPPLDLDRGDVAGTVEACAPAGAHELARVQAPVGQHLVRRDEVAPGRGRDDQVHAPDAQRHQRVDLGVGRHPGRRGRRARLHDPPVVLLSPQAEHRLVMACGTDHRLTAGGGEAARLQQVRRQRRAFQARVHRALPAVRVQLAHRIRAVLQPRGQQRHAARAVQQDRLRLGQVGQLPGIFIAGDRPRLLVARGYAPDRQPAPRVGGADQNDAIPHLPQGQVGQASDEALRDCRDIPELDHPPRRSPW